MILELDLRDILEDEISNRMDKNEGTFW